MPIDDATDGYCAAQPSRIKEQKLPKAPQPKTAQRESASRVLPASNVTEPCLSTQPPVREQASSLSSPSNVGPRPNSRSRPLPAEPQKAVPSPTEPHKGASRTS